MLGGRLFADSGATLIDVQVGYEGDGVAKPGQRGALAGDYALWLNTSAPPGSVWTPIASSPISVLGRQLTSGDLALAIVPNQPWGLVIYRDVTSAAKRAETGFAKSAGHVGVFGVSIGIAYPAPPTLISPEGATLRLTQINPPTFAAYDLIAPAGPYVDGTPFTPAAGSWGVIELLRI